MHRKPSKPQPVVVLVHPRLPENIGMCARAMLNCGLERLRLVAPEVRWPHGRALAAAANAVSVLEGAEVCATLDEALADCVRVYATTARERSAQLPVMTAGEAVPGMLAACGAGEEVAILFGPETAGLDAEAVSRAEALVRFPTNPEYRSLNLAQAVLLFAWEWWQAAMPPEAAETSAPPPASREALGHFFARLDRALDERGFYLTEALRPHSARTLRTFFSRAAPTEEELRYLHGLLSALLRE